MSVISHFSCSTPLKSHGRLKNDSSILYPKYFRNSAVIKQPFYSSKAMEQPPPRPPKKAHLQNRKLSPNSIIRLEQKKLQSAHNVKYKPPAPEPEGKKSTLPELNPSPPDLNATAEWMKQMNSRGILGMDSSDSGCSSLASTTTSPLNSGYYQKTGSDIKIENSGKFFTASAYSYRFNQNKPSGS